MKVLNSPSLVHGTDESIDDDEVRVIAKKVYDACFPPSREQSPFLMDTIPPTISSPPKTASPPPSTSQNTPIPPPSKSPPSPVPKGQKPTPVPISKEQPAVPNPKEHPAETNPHSTFPSSSQNPTIGAPYT
ncbi:vegetative cell wall protein gp1-like [Beta vulgaris subsp. vulgaris]|uniref:vegetative cell wall protein gp1-like n=1 Tax=Beta vulgaris subsp. vulgaris TaxID=3555 RepID=UPI00053FC121|nr:vegetative cell wall protein gp1-like [Beta vulgaris subsp. vulgaris]